MSKTKFNTFQPTLKANRPPKISAIRLKNRMAFANDNVIGSQYLHNFS